MNLYQYAVLWHPTEKQEEDGKSSVIAVDVTTILARDEKSAVLQAARAVPEEFVEDVDQLEVVVRPF